MIDRHANKRMTDSLRLMQEIQQDTYNNTATMKNESSIKRKPLKEAHGYVNQARPSPYPTKTQKQLKNSTLRSDTAPFSTMNSTYKDIDNDSILSSWSLSEDVKRILYPNSVKKKPTKEPLRESHKAGRVTFKLAESSEDDEEELGYYRDTVVMRDSVVIPTLTENNESLMGGDDDESRDTASLLAGFTE